LRATLEKIGIAVNECRGAMAYWSVGLLKTRAWWNEICFYMDGSEQKIESDHHLLIRYVQYPVFPLRHYSNAPLLHEFSDGQNRFSMMKSKPGSPGRIFTF